jgi:hypothetical protein
MLGQVSILEERRCKKIAKLTETIKTSELGLKDKIAE